MYTTTHRNTTAQNMNTRRFYKATPKQAAFLGTLLSERTVDAAMLARIDQARAAYRQGTLDGNAISDLISDVKRIPRNTTAPVAAPANSNPVSSEGFYTDGTDIFKVTLSKYNRYYASRLVLPAKAKCGGCEACDGEDRCDITSGSIRWEFDRDAIKTLTADSKLTMEQAAAYGQRTGHCFCGRTLQDDISRAYYIGPVCQERQFGVKRSKSQAEYAKAHAILVARGEL